jgi:hypothetical protein
MGIELGEKYRDEISGFEGVATGHAEYLYGCEQTMLSGSKHDSHEPDCHWFDDQRLIHVESGARMGEQVVAGGPQQAPSRAN